MDESTLYIPNCNKCIHPGDVVRLHRFESDEWVVGYGWYTFGGNRPFCGWYLRKVAGMTVKPLQLPDLDDIYVIKR